MDRDAERQVPELDRRVAADDHRVGHRHREHAGAAHHDRQGEAVEVGQMAKDEAAAKTQRQRTDSLLAAQAADGG